MLFRILDRLGAVACDERRSPWIRRTAENLREWIAWRAAKSLL